MKLYKITALALILGLFSACGGSESNGDGNGNNGTDSTATPPKAETYNVQTEGAKLLWLASKDEGQHWGSMKLKGGTVMATESGVTGGEITIDVASLSVDEEGSEEYAGKLAGHLTSPDFFDTEQFPTATVKITGSSAYSGGEMEKPENLPAGFAEMVVANPTHMVEAMFTAKGEEKAISFPAKISMSGDKLTGEAFFTIDRRAHGLRFKSDTENNVHADVRIGLSFEATK